MGTQRAYDLAALGAQADTGGEGAGRDTGGEGTRGDIGGEGAEGDTGGEGAGAPVARIADPDDEPPPLLPDLPEVAGAEGGCAESCSEGGGARDGGAGGCGRKKTPPNDPCVCGSGTKYKRCCGK